MEELALGIAPYWHQEAEKWRTEAFKQHPTQEAYDAACAALHKHRESANKAESDAEKWREHTRKCNIELAAADEREKKLKERLEEVKELAKWSDNTIYVIARDVLEVLYPKEDESK